MIEQLYRETFEGVRRAAGRVLREPADRDAIVQQVFADLVSSRSLRASYRGGDRAAWLSAIARHRAIDFARRERRLVELDPAGPPADEAAGELAELRNELRRFAERLPPDRRRLVELRFLAGMTQFEAAAQMSVPRSTLEDWERQLKRALAAYLLGEVAPEAARDGAEAGRRERARGARSSARSRSEEEPS